jgi:hypothetical protein
MHVGIWMNSLASDTVIEIGRALTRSNIMMRLVSRTLLLSLLSSGAMAQSSATPAKHLRIYRTEHSAQQRCPSDKIVWANTTSHTLHLPGDPHHAHTHGGYACESEARARGYRGPVAHA